MTDKEQIELELTDMASEGDAVGRHDDRLFFAPFGVTGDRVRVRVVEESKRFNRAEIVEIISPSAYRIEAPCPHFGVCSGCQWQHIDYSKQLELKRTIVAEQLKRQGNWPNPPVEPAIGMDDPWAYRSQLDFSVNSEGQKGFPDAEYLNIIPLQTCLIADSWLWDLADHIELSGANLQAISIRTGLNTDEALIVFETAHDSAPELELDLPVSCVLRRSDGSVYPLVGDAFYYEVIGERTFRISADSFFHPNIAALEVLIALVEQLLEPVGYETLVDVFCGVGTFGISLADRVGHVIGIEEDFSALEDARVNGADCDNFTLMEGPAENVLKTITVPVQLAVVDPPWEGCPEGALEALNKVRPQRIVYLSSNLFALTRDANQLDQMGYHLQTVQPVDMFPQTSLVQTVSLWSLAP